MECEVTPVLPVDQHDSHHAGVHHHHQHDPHLLLIKVLKFGAQIETIVMTYVIFDTFKPKLSPPANEIGSY